MIKPKADKGDITKPINKKLYPKNTEIYSPKGLSRGLDTAKSPTTKNSN